MRRAQAMWNDESGAAAQIAPARMQTPSPASPGPRRPKIGLALGAGAARGWCHIGILQEFEAAGLRPDIIAGTSIGALVGGCYAAGQLEAVERFSLSLSRRRVLSLLDLSFSGGGLFSGARLREKLEAALVGKTVEGLPIPFAAVATEISTGHEIWLRSGPLARALNASYALPGLLEPLNVDGRWLFDGALVNPIPVSVCRAHGRRHRHRGERRLRFHVPRHGDRRPQRRRRDDRRACAKGRGCRRSELARRRGFADRAHQAASAPQRA
ncbi:MAG: patatin-like phospholipase family protein [Rhodoblastus sp.]